MRPDPVVRLQRTLPGDSLVLREASAVRVRKVGRVASASPNAPLLMRIVRTPYRLPLGRPVRVDVMPPEEPFTRVDAREERALARSDRDLLPTRAPGGQRPRAFTVRPSRFVLLPPELPADEPA